MHAHLTTGVIAAAATAGVILRPFNMPEAIWAVAGAALLVAIGSLAPMDAWAGVAKGTDVYLFLIGMMLLAELARLEGLFDWLATVAARSAQGSASRLFGSIYVVGIIVTTLLSNDAAAVVLTPAVIAVVRAAEAREPLPYLLVCAFIANAASFVLPISNPANLVLYASQMPPLAHWLALYAIPSLFSIAVTYIVLRWTQRDALRQKLRDHVPAPELSSGGKFAAWGIAATAIILLAASAFDMQLGLPTACAGALTTAFVLLKDRKNPWPFVKNISWGVLPLVGGLFVLVEALDMAGLIAALGDGIRRATHESTTGAAWSLGLVIAFVSNLMNNLPAGFIAASALQGGEAPERVTAAALIGVNLGPNLSVTGSLATILWLNALRREGLKVSAWTFLKVGSLVMPPALIAAMAGLFLFG
jgi:arsenical pump membrane protein